MKLRLSALAVALGLIACSASGADEPVGASTQSIADGDLDVTHESVFALVTHHGQEGALCTGTLIAPNLILTARHCVSETGAHENVVCGDAAFTSTIPGDAVFATNDAQPDGNSSWFQGADIRVPSEGDDTCGFDVALVILQSNVPAQVAQPTVPRIDREVVAGEPYIAIGYGQDENGQEAEGRMLLGNLEVQCAPGDCPAYAIKSTEFLGETGICSGDSGGPALDADGKVVGVVSRGSDGCQTPIYGTVTAWRDLIVSTALEAAKLGGYEAPFWALSGSSDPPPDEGQPGSGGGSASGGALTPCDSPSDCSAGSVCHYRDDPADAVCRLTCAEDDECGDGEVCQAIGDSDVSVCLTPKSDGADESGCAVVPGSRGASSSLAWAWLVAGVAFVAGRRTRK
jgi:V8-like Glu-specific endopeptidase